MKLLGAIASCVILVGCSVTDEKTHRYEDITTRFLLPDEVEVRYERKGNTISGWERRCFGAGCNDKALLKATGDLDGN